MNNKTVVVILLIALLLFAFIVFFEKGSMSTGERNQRRNHLFVDYKADAVERFTITNTAGETVEVTSGKDSQTGAKKWAINAPVPLDTEPSEVQSVLSALDYVLKNRTVQGRDKIDAPKYGLAQPRIRGAFTVKGQPVSFRIGGDTQDDKVYLALDGVADEIYVVDREFFTSMNKTRDDLRLKKIVTGSLNEAHRIHIAQARTPLKLQRRDQHPWQVEIDGSYILADNRQVHELLQTIGDLRATRFVADGLGDSELPRYGLDRPASSVTIYLPDEQTVPVLVGSPCPEQPLHRYVTVAGTGTVACVKDDFLPLVERPARQLMETRPAVFEDDDIVRIHLARDSRTLILEKEEGVWRAVGNEPSELEQSAIEELLGTVRETKASGIEVGEKALARLGEAAASIRLDSTAGSGHRELTFYRDPVGRSVRVTRSGEPAVLSVPHTMLESVRPHVLAFRKRLITSGDAHDVEQLSIRGPVAQRLEKRAGLWTVVEPIEVAADGDAARRLAALTTTVTPIRFVSLQAETAHGFETPFAVITATIAVESFDGKGPKDQTKSRDIVLQLGARTDDQLRFARLLGEDQTVFVVGPEYEEAIRNPFVARDLLQISETDPVRLVFERSGERLVLHKDGLTWSAAGERQIDPAHLKRLLSELSAVKTVRAASYDAPAKGFRSKTLVITATLPDTPDKTVVLTVGPRSDDAAENGYLARLNGLPVTFVVPARLVDELIAFTEG